MQRASNAMFIPAMAVATAEDEVSHQLGVKVWYQGVCTAKKAGVTALVKNVKPKVIYVLPGRVCFIKSEIDQSLRIQAALIAEKTLFIDDALKVTVNKKELTFEYPDGEGVKKEVFTFESEKSATECNAAIQEERTRVYVHSDNFTPKFKENLDTAIRFKIRGGDEALRTLFLSCCTHTPPPPPSAPLSTNHRTLVYCTEPAVSFGDVLRAAAHDPVVYILFLCCVIDAGSSMFEHFQRLCGHEIDNTAELFEKLLKHITSTVSQPAWKTKRDLFLKQFMYPVPATEDGTAGEFSYQILSAILLA
jgi:hypothetical protein